MGWGIRGMGNNNKISIIGIERSNVTMQLGIATVFPSLTRRYGV